MQARFLLYLIVWLVPLISWSQRTDTLDEVLINAPRWSGHNSTIFELRLQEEQIVTSTIPNSFNALNAQFGLLSINYGSSGLIVPRIRGTNPEHTAVIWNGININHAGLGQSNGFNLPLLSNTDLTVALGGASAPFGSSAIAGSILIDDRIDFNENKEFTISSSIGSFGTYKMKTAYNTSDEMNASGIEVYHLQSQNDFEYINTSDFRRPLVRQNNSAFSQSGIKANFSNRLGKHHQIRFHSWIHEGCTEIQPAMSNRVSEDSQKDHLHRYKLSHLYNSSIGFIQSDVFYTSDDIDYNGNYSGVKRFGVRSSLNKALTAFSNSHFGFNLDHYIPNYSNYPASSTETRLSFFALNKFDFKRLHARINLRYTAVDGYEVPLTSNVSLAYSVLQRTSQFLKIKGSYSNNFRLPTLNERYWTPGGNPDILPEKSNQYELGFEAVAGKFRIQNAFFIIDIRDAVQWRLMDSVWSESEQDFFYSVFSPININDIRSRGINSRLSWNNLQFGRFNASMGISYNYTNAIDSEAKEQRLYTPFHSMTSFLGVEFNDYVLNTNYQMVSERRTSSSWLDAYTILDMSLSKTIYFEQHTLNASFQVHNLLDASYQTFLNRAMPGRNYSLTITYKLHKNE